MIMYDKLTGIYRSNHSTYDVMGIEPSLMFQWIKTNQITASGFKYWLQSQLEIAESKGAEQAGARINRLCHGQGDYADEYQIVNDGIEKFANG